MSQSGHSVVSECGPGEAWDALSEDPAAQMVDVRTRAEWSFVGVPDLADLSRQVHLVEWRSFPQMAPNPNFADEVMDALAGAVPSKLYFICRSGARSMEAAHAMAQAFDQKGASVACVNVAEGFEGDLDTNRHRGRKNGWKARNLSWRQS